MQTDQFDEEFRKKLLDLNPGTNEGEVERIHNFITSKGKITPLIPWSKYLMYAAACAMLATSLLCNYVQLNTARKLKSSVDSLKEKITLIGTISSERTFTRVDTVYINRYINTVLSQPANDNTGLQREQNINSKQLYARQTSLQPTDFAADSHLLNNSLQGPFPEPGLKLAAKAALNENKFGKSGQIINRSSDSQPPREDILVEKSLIPENSSGQENVGGSPEKSDRTYTNGSTQTSDETVAQITAFANLNYLKRLMRNSSVPSLPFISIPKKSVTYSPNKKTSATDWLQSRLDNVSLYAGAGFDAGSSQLGGSLLGEVRLSKQWSFQTGLRWLDIIGDQYFTAEQYGTKTGKDFRALYAPYVPQNFDVLNIEENYQLLQLPVSIYYHHYLDRNWALRLGLGTDLSLYSRNRITFDYKENNTSFKSGAYSAPVPVGLLNNITVNAGVERYWNKFIFRISPFATLQTRNVVYYRENWAFGARIQVLYKLR